MVRLNVECKDFGKNIFIINYLFINFNMLYFIFKKIFIKIEILFSGDLF